MFSRPSLTRPAAVVLLSAALLAPLPFLSTPTASAAPQVASRQLTRTTHLTLSTYGKPNRTVLVYVTLLNAYNSSLRHHQKVSLWAKEDGEWTKVDEETTRKNGTAEFSVKPEKGVSYQVRYAGSETLHTFSSKSRSVTLFSKEKVTLSAPESAVAQRTFAISGRVAGAPAGRAVNITGDGVSLFTVYTKADGSYSGHVRLRRTTKLRAVTPTASSLVSSSSTKVTVYPVSTTVVPPARGS